MIRDIKNLFDQEEDYYKLVKVGNFYSNNYVQYERKVDKTISIKEHRDKIKSYLNDI